jgi:hypothetical protein
MEKDLETMAHNKRELRLLLIHHNFLSFRAQITFPGDGKPYKKTFYGNEHRCTYNQCLAGYVPYILLKKQMGYLALIDMIERKFKGQFSYANIYMRTEEIKKNFPVICRQYTSTGEDLELRQDPVLSEDEISIIHFSVNPLNRRLLLHGPQPVVIDFKKEVEKNLSKFIPVDN